MAQVVPILDWFPPPPKEMQHHTKAETEFGELFDKFGSPAPKKKQKVLKDGPNDSAEKEEREDATSASIGATASGAQEQKTRCVLKEAPKMRREKTKKAEEAKEKQVAAETTKAGCRHSIFEGAKSPRQDATGEKSKAGWSSTHRRSRT